MIDLSFDNRKAIVEELRYIAKRMLEEKDAFYQNYLFSGAYGVVFRILNLQFQPDLVLMHEVMRQTYQALEVRIQSIAAGQEKVIKIPAETYASLADALLSLASNLDANAPYLEPLIKIAVAGYVTTGNGYYLYQKGLLKLDSEKGRTRKVPVIMIKCPETGKPISTGMAMDEASFKTAVLEGNAVKCPVCGKAHTWSKKDAWLD